MPATKSQTDDKKKTNPTTNRQDRRNDTENSECVQFTLCVQRVKKKKTKIKNKHSNVIDTENIDSTTMFVKQKHWLMNS